MTDAHDYDPAAETVGDAIRRLEISIRLARAEYEQAIKPWSEVSDQDREILAARRAGEAEPLLARWQAFGEALAVIMGWPAAEAEKDGMVQTLLEFLEDELDEGPLDVPALKARVEACAREWRGF